MYDNATAFSVNQALTASAASTNTLDLGDTLHQIGQSVKKLNLVVVVGTAFAGSMTSMNVALQDSADNASFADTNIKVSSVLKAALVAGVLVLDVPLPRSGAAAQIAGLVGSPPPGPSPIRRYVQVYYTLNGGAASAGKVYAYLDVD